MTEQGDKPVVTQAVNAKDEWIAFQSWWKRTIPHEHVPSPTSHFFDVWMGSARHREALSSELEAIAYLHTLHMEGGQTYERLTTFDGTDSATAFGVPGRDYSEEYVVTTTPLYAALSASEGRDVGREALGRFGHHPDPAIDFCHEVECCENDAFDLRGEVGVHMRGALLLRIERAMTFRVGGDQGCVAAKRRLRDLEQAMKEGRERQHIDAVIAARASPEQADQADVLREAGGKERSNEAREALDELEAHEAALKTQEG